MSLKQYLIQYKHKNYALLKKKKKIRKVILNEISMHVYHVKFSSIEQSITNIIYAPNMQYLIQSKIFHAAAQLLFIRI
jgi:hypothetical protein